VCGLKRLGKLMTVSKRDLRNYLFSSKVEGNLFGECFIVRTLEVMW